MSDDKKVIFSMQRLRLTVHLKEKANPNNARN
jgi:hypothetical protein